MKKRVLALFCAMLFVLAGCGQTATQSDAQEPAQQQAAEPAAEPETAPQQETVEAAYEDGVVLRVASLKGPTSMGLASLMTDENEHYQFEMHTAADEIVPLLVKGEIDGALIPANLAATLYKKTEGKIAVLNINTLGVLEVVAPASEQIGDLTALKGKTVYMTGKGTTPESALRYLIEKSGMQWEDLKVEFKSEATEVVAALKSDPTACAVLPQPFATVATQQLDNMSIQLSLTELWSQLSDDDSQLVTGVTVVRKAFAEEHPAALAQFQNDAAASVEYVNTHPAEAAALIEQLDIVKAGIAKLAIPRCNLVSMTGTEMQTALNGYLNALYDFSPELVGGELPDADFYLV